MIASFLAIPLMIEYLGQEKYGVWSTLLTVMSWVVFFDLGVGSGLRNKVAESLARNEYKEAGNYVASSYTIIAIITLILWLVITFLSYLLPWQTIFNTKILSESSLRLTIQISAFFILLNFWVGLIGALLGATQKTSLIAFGQLVSNLLILCLVFALSKTTNNSLSYLAIIYGLSLVTANILLSVWFYRRNVNLRPRPYVNRQHFRPLLSVGLQFFIIQLAVLIIFSTDKMMITQIFGPKYVTQYEVVYKIFSVITLVHSLVSAPLWSAYTDAYHRQDFPWIKGMLKKQLIIFGFIIVCIVGLVVLAQSIIFIWVGRDFIIPNSLIILMGLQVIISVWNNIFGLILAGIGKVRLGAIYTIVTATLNIPLSYYFSVTSGLGLSGIVLGTILSIAISSVVSPIQVYFFIYSRIKHRFLYSILR